MTSMTELHLLTDIVRSGTNEITAKAEVPSGSPWFSGHFPDNPILPGVAILSIVFNTITESYGRKLKLVSISRVRFKKVITPCVKMLIHIKLADTDEGTCAFDVTADGKLACSGVMTVGEDL